MEPRYHDYDPITAATCLIDFFETPVYMEREEKGHKELDLVWYAKNKTCRLRAPNGKNLVIMEANPDRLHLFTLEIPLKFGCAIEAAWWYANVKFDSSPSTTIRVVAFKYGNFHGQATQILKPEHQPLSGTLLEKMIRNNSDTTREYSPIVNGWSCLYDYYIEVDYTDKQDVCHFLLKGRTDNE